MTKYIYYIGHITKVYYIIIMSKYLNYLNFKKGTGN